jgi:hypothetical protein
LIYPTKMQNKKPIYVNPKQAAVLTSRQRRKAFLGGRGAGKTTVAGHFSLDACACLPRAKFFLLGLTYNQIQSIFLPSMMAAWEKRGLKEYIDARHPGHYVVGKRPPDDFATPYQRPRNYENQITFFNGFTLSMLSFDRSDRNRGGNFDGGIVDEATLINKDRYDKEMKPMIRGNIYRFNTHYHHSELLVSSQSWTAAGDWFPDLEFDAIANPDDVLFVQASAYDNIEVLGERYLKDLQRDLPGIIFDVEVLNMRRKKIANSFYDELDEEKHGYYNSYAYDQTESGLLVTKSTSTDYDPTLPLEISFDFNAAFNSCIVGQEHNKGLFREARVINNFYVKNKKIDYLVEDVCNYYKGHQNKVMIWGDRNGNNKQANSEDTYYEQIIKQFKAAGFKAVELMVHDRLDPLHALKHYVLNVLLAEKDMQLPRIRINQIKCKATIISMQCAPVTGDFKKDKTSEREKNLPQEKATHLSDCFDNWIYPKYNHLIEGKTYSYRAKVIGR